jgi:hypothetical protein
MLASVVVHIAKYESSKQLLTKSKATPKTSSYQDQWAEAANTKQHFACMHKKASIIARQYTKLRTRAPIHTNRNDISAQLSSASL